MRRSDLHNPGLATSLRLGSFHAEAFSISGLATYVTVPSLDLSFDLGHCSVEASHCRSVLLTHVHQDHALGIVRHLSLRAMTSQSPSRIYLPDESLDATTEMLRAFRRMEGKDPEDLGATLIPVAPGASFELKPRVRVQAFDVNHRLASRGYTVRETRRKLKARYRSLPGEEIQAAHARGEELYDYREINVVTYIGDSTIETLRRHPEVGDSEVLFLEATHLPGTSLDASARYGHTHLDELVALFHEAPDTLRSPHIVLKHFSMKYSERDIRAAVQALPSGLRERVTALV